MSDYLVIKGNNNNTRSYSLNSTYSYKPYLKVSNGYLDLTTETGTDMALNVKEGNKTYRPIQSSSSSTSKEYNTSSTYTSSDSYHTTTRVSNYTGSVKSAISTYYGAGTSPTGNASRTWTDTYTGAAYVTSCAGKDQDVLTPCKNQAIQAAKNNANAAAAAYIKNISNISGTGRMAFTAPSGDNGYLRHMASTLLMSGYTSATANATSQYYAPLATIKGNNGYWSHQWATEGNAAGYGAVTINSTCNFNGGGDTYNSVTYYVTAKATGSVINRYYMTTRLTKVTSVATRSQQSNYTRSSGYTDYYYTQTSNYTSSSSTSASTTIV